MLGSWKIEIPRHPGRDLVQFDKKRREARTKGQVAYICDLLFCSVLHRLFTKEDKGVDLYVIDMPILDTRREKNLLGTFISDLVLSLLSYVAENERSNIRQRQAEGIAAAKARGVHFGRRPNPLPENFYEVYQLWKMKKISVSEAAKRCGMPQTTFFERARAFGNSTLTKEKKDSE